jgi:hypothetical protein
MGLKARLSGQAARETPVRGSTIAILVLRAHAVCVTRNANMIPAALQRARVPEMAAAAMTNAAAGDGAPPDMGAMLANLDLRSLCQGLSSGGCCMGMALDVNKAIMDLNCMVRPHAEYSSTRDRSIPPAPA